MKRKTCTPTKADAVQPTTNTTEVCQRRRMNATERAQEHLTRYVPAYRVATAAARIPLDELLYRLDR